MREWIARGAALAVGFAVVAGVLLFGLAQQRKLTQVGDQVDPEIWAAAYPRHYASFMRTARDYGRTPYGGGRYDKLAANPFRRRAFAGHPFELEYNAARGHHFAQIDQRESRRTRERVQPAACIHCHAAEAPQLTRMYGWLGLTSRTYSGVKNRLHFGSSCADCHEPSTMALRVTRHAFVEAMRARGIDLSKATRVEMRSYVCAQCHSEYYFRGPQKELVFPWRLGTRLDDIERYYDETNFSDWTHPETGAALIKIQHPDFELYSAGLHATLGVACADCHMPYINEDGLMISDHWVRSPLTNIEAACLNCHDLPADQLAARTVNIQRRSTGLLGFAETTIQDLIEAISTARAAGVPEPALADALRAHRRAQLRWDFVDAENSTGFHAPGEATRILTEAVRLARDGARSAMQAVSNDQGQNQSGRKNSLNSP